MARGPDAATLLARALTAQLQPLGGAIVDADYDRWASATFVGARHRIALTCRDAAPSQTWFAGLSEADWSLRGHLVADVHLVSRSVRDGQIAAVIRVLTVEVD